VRGLLVLLCASLAVPHEPARRVPSGRAVALVDSPRRWDLDDAIPHDGDYARGARLDAAGKFVEALRAYSAALRALAAPSSLSRFGPDLEGRCVEAWRAKIMWQREQTEHIVEGESYAQVMPTVAVAHFNLAAAYHRKVLALRSYLGRAPRRLWEQARAEYLHALEIDPRHVLARLGLAALLAAADLHDEARAEVAVLGRHRDDEDLALYVAAFEAANGDDDAAMAALARVAPRAELRRWALRVSDFDGLRGDPRWLRMFAPVAGDDEALLVDCRKR
jgi:tetratricopeptide (TPR) repeat protein